MMSLYSIYADKDNYRYLGFDREQSRRIFGDDPRHQFDVNGEAKPCAPIWKPLRVNFDDDGHHGSRIPDISEHDGRLFLSLKAYDALKSLIEKDGEFLPVTFENGMAYMFNPLSIAEDVDGLDTKLTQKNEWGDFLNIAFHENRVTQFAVFRANIDNHRTVYCQESVKKAIENAGLKGVYFTPDLGNPYTLQQAKNLRNG